MAFVKLDCGILDSTLWVDRLARELFITALLMAEPIEVEKPLKTIKIQSLEDGGFIVPEGWYGFVPAAGSGIIHRAGIDLSTGVLALERLSAPEAESRTPDHEGRRMVRVSGGYIILNFDKYRQKDHTAAERARRYREKKAASRVTNVTSRVTSRSVTQAEAEAEAEVNTKSGYAVPACFEKVEGFSAALAGWIEHRKKIKKPATGRAIQILINKLSERPSDAVRALDTIVMNGWQGFQWEWMDKNGNGSTQSPKLLTASEQRALQAEHDAAQERNAHQS